MKTVTIKITIDPNIGKHAGIDLQIVEWKLNVFCSNLKGLGYISAEMLVGQEMKDCKKKA